MSKYNYAKEQMAAALLACRNERMGVRRASALYSVPRSTLSDKLRGKTPDVCRCGPDTILTKKVHLLTIIYLINIILGTDRIRHNEIVQTLLFQMLWF